MDHVRTAVHPRDPSSPALRTLGPAVATQSPCLEPLQLGESQLRRQDVEPTLAVRVVSTTDSSGKTPVEPGENGVPPGTVTGGQTTVVNATRPAPHWTPMALQGSGG
jgi:hypothetical protein